MHFGYNNSNAEYSMEGKTLLSSVKPLKPVEEGIN